MTGKQRREQTIRLARAPEPDRRRIIATMSWQDVLDTDADYERWVGDGQIPPSGEGWRVWLMMAGRGFGKTRAGAEWISRLAQARPGARIAIVGATIAEARSVMIEGVSGLLSVARGNRGRIGWEPSMGRLKWPNGSEAQIFSGDNADGLRGSEHDFAWCDELAKWREAEAAWANLQMGLRRGARARALVTTTPRPMALLERIDQDRWTVTTRGRTSDNLSLDAKFVEVMAATYGGTRIGRQELDGELLQDVEGSLWPHELIERSRASVDFARDEWTWDRVVIGVDPPAGAGEGCDACGIVVAARLDGKLYVLSDETVAGLRPEGWASRVAAAAARWGASLVVAEANNGGAMVESVLKAAEAELKVKLVHASRGKVARAEPVALRFETGRAFLAGRFPELEAELAGLVAGGDYQGPGRSPDRADAMVWALTELSETRSGLPRVSRL